MREVIVLVVFAGLLASPGPAAAQAPAGKGAPASTPPAATPAAPAAPATPVAPEGHTYRPEGRRDPFISLLRRGSDSASAPSNARGPGLKGLGAGEVTLRGTIASQGGYVAILQGADSKTYIVRPGEQLADGTIRSITADAMVILQQVNDPLSLEKQREVRKVLRQTEEGRQ
jgi:Tfp pilus assembly protein PilP